MFIGNKKCRIYAACGVSQTPIIIFIQGGGEIMAYTVPEISTSSSANVHEMGLIAATVIGSVLSGVSGGIASAVFG